MYMLQGLSFLTLSGLGLNHIHNCATIPERIDILNCMTGNYKVKDVDFLALTGLISH